MIEIKVSEVAGRHRQRSTRLQLDCRWSHVTLDHTADHHPPSRVTSVLFAARRYFVPYLPRCHPQKTPTGDSFTFDLEDGQVIEEVVGPASLTDPA